MVFLWLFGGFVTGRERSEWGVVHLIAAFGRIQVVVFVQEMVSQMREAVSFAAGKQIALLLSLQADGPACQQEVFLHLLLDPLSNCQKLLSHRAVLLGLEGSVDVVDRPVAALLVLFPQLHQLLHRLHLRVQLPHRRLVGLPDLGLELEPVLDLQECSLPPYEDDLSGEFVAFPGHSALEFGDLGSWVLGGSGEQLQGFGLLLEILEEVELLTHEVEFGGVGYLVGDLVVVGLQFDAALR